MLRRLRRRVCARARAFVRVRARAFVRVRARAFVRVRARSVGSNNNNNRMVPMVDRKSAGPVPLCNVYAALRHGLCNSLIDARVLGHSVRRTPTHRMGARAHESPPDARSRVLAAATTTERPAGPLSSSRTSPSQLSTSRPLRDQRPNGFARLCACVDAAHAWHCRDCALRRPALTGSSGGGSG